MGRPSSEGAVVAMQVLAESSWGSVMWAGRQQAGDLETAKGMENQTWTKIARDQDAWGRGY